jgi:ribosomal protein RSM22 (predicted rRNA methylase)
MTKELLNNLNDAVDLAIHLQKEANENKIETEKKNHLRYLGQCLRVMKEQIDDGRKRIKDTKECGCRGESPCSLPS